MAQPVLQILASFPANLLFPFAVWAFVETGTTLAATGLGAYIAAATESGDFHQILAGVAVMSFYIVTLNRLLWRRLYRIAETRFTLSSCVDRCQSWRSGRAYVPGGAYSSLLPEAMASTSSTVINGVVETATRPLDETVMANVAAALLSGRSQIT